jgi:hypothetical protein
MVGVLTSRKLLLLLATGIFALVIGAVFVAYGYTRRTARNAETLLSDMQALHLNASQVDAQRFLDEHAAVAGVKEVNCTDQQRTECVLVIRLDNRWLAKLRLAPPTTFAVEFTTSRGRVFRMGAGIVVRRQEPQDVQYLWAAGVTEQLFRPETAAEPFVCIHKLRNMYGKVTLPLVQFYLDERATPDQRKSAYSSLNLSCLDKLGGCRDAEALAPSAWTPADKVWHGDETTKPESQ